MNRRTKLLSVLLGLAVLVSLTMACTLPGLGGAVTEEETPAPPPAGETPAPPPPAETPPMVPPAETPVSGQRCGDGICDGPENPQTCPQDCAPPAAPGELSQWAISAFASSEYSSPEWSAQQATGAPDTPECGDYQTAWASESYDGVDWLEVGYATPVRPVRINIHETNWPGFIVRVEVKDEAGMYHTVWQGTPGPLDQCPSILSLPVTGIESRVVAVRINLDQRASDDWDEIDAVELIGLP